MSDTTREQADRWWDAMSMYGRLGVYVEHGASAVVTFGHGAWREWWRSLPDERAARIYEQDNAR